MVCKEYIQHEEDNNLRKYGILNVCCNILRVPLLVIQSVARLSMIPIIPREQLLYTPVLICIDDNCFMETRPIEPQNDDETKETQRHGKIRDFR